MTTFPQRGASRAAVPFFASDDAAFITGQSLSVCGGIIFH